MQTTEKNEIPELIEKITKASQKMTQNYFKNLSTYIHNDKDIAKTYSTLFNTITWNPDELLKVQDSYYNFLQNQMEVSKRIIERQKNEKEYSPLVSPRKGDKRFLAPEWDEYPYYFDYIKQNYLLVSDLIMDTIESISVDDKTKRKLSFYTQQYLDALSPSNFFATNPEVIKMAIETKGESLKEGFRNLLGDLEKGSITQTDGSAFEVGKNIAITQGSVIYENELIQLIQYAPATKQVHEIPLLIIPPWINKYYILDLRPENSFAKFMVEQGFTVFMISWRNPTPDMGYLTFDDYVDEGTLKAINVIKSVTGAEGVNALGYCLGGTLLGVSAAILGKRKSKALHSATFLAAMLDFSDVGPMGDVIDEALVRKLERGELQNRGVMHGHDMETAFNLIRANDLIWSYVVNNYLKGKTPTPFDVLYWTNDNTNLPAKMYTYYLRNMVLENKLSRKNALRICNEPIDLAKIEIPAFVIGTHEDHISPHRTAFITTELVSGPVEFVLGGSGHVMGVANPPSRKKYGYHINGKLGNGYDEWKNTAEFHEGSWWTPYSKWLEKQSGKRISVKAKLGNGNFKVIEPAPGRYAKEKNSKHPDHV